ncbi:hypothetical protein BZZ01_11970 [Nostocales cyanobacterium HT-58-2]|nr:hypothetical protein BZZ01_11970 [Nostocales cyanobacterium HT-58-2]
MDKLLKCFIWGRKISDLAFGEFLQILEWIAKKKGKQVIFIEKLGIKPPPSRGTLHLLDLSLP